MPLVTDFRLSLLGYDFTAKTEWNIDVEETLGQPGTARFRLQDENMAGGDFQDLDPGNIGFTLADLPMEVTLDGVERPLFSGKILHDEVDLPSGFPWRIHDVAATDWQREVFDRRYIGTPNGDTWEGPDSDGLYIATDGGALFDSGSIAGKIASIFDDYARLPAFIGAIDATTFVHDYGDIEGAPLMADKATVRSVMEWLAGQISGNLQYWMDSFYRIHWQVIPRWFQQEGPAFNLALGLPETGFPMEAAPVEINNDAPDGVASVGCRNLGWGFDYGNILYQHYISGGVGFKYNGGLVDYGGSGWVVFGNASGVSRNIAQGILDVPFATDAVSKLNAARRAESAVAQGILRGHLTVGNERHHPDGFYVGQSIKITDERMPDYLNGRYYTIQRVRTSLVPFQNWRVYDIEWGDAPLARSSSRRPLMPTTEEIQEPGRLWDITGRIQNPLPSSTITVVGQLLNERYEPRRVLGEAVELELHVWDETGTPQTGIGSISPTSVTSDIMGRWATQLTVGPGQGWSYCVQPIGANSCGLPTA